MTRQRYLVLAAIIVFALLWWKAGPAIKAALAGRTERIAKEMVEKEAKRNEDILKRAEEREASKVKARLEWSSTSTGPRKLIPVRQRL